MLSSKYKHSVILEDDYFFASEFHLSDDPRFSLTELYKSYIEEDFGERPYNCRIEQLLDIYNVYVYFYDITQVPWQQGIPLPVYNNVYAEQFKLLFYRALVKCPFKELESIELNPNGITVRDYLIRARAHVLNKADVAIYSFIKKQHSDITLAIRSDTEYYLFFRHAEDMDEYREGDSADDFKESLRQLIKDYDENGVWGNETPTIVLDDFANIDGIGTQRYFS